MGDMGMDIVSGGRRRRLMDRRSPSPSRKDKEGATGLFRRLVYRVHLAGLGPTWQVYPLGCGV